MRSKSLWGVGLLGLLASLALGSDEKEQASNPARDSLKGIKELKVVFCDFKENEKKMGFDTDVFKTQVELRLRRSGIKVNNDAVPYLYVNINVVPLNRNDGLAAVTMRAKFLQPAKLYANDLTMYGTTWDESATGFAEHNKVRTMKDRMEEIVDLFINDYLAANQK